MSTATLLVRDSGEDRGEAGDGGARRLGYFRDHPNSAPSNIRTLCTSTGRQRRHRITAGSGDHPAQRTRDILRELLQKRFGQPLDRAGAPSDRIRTACCLRATLSESRSRIRPMTRRTSCQSAGGVASMARSRSSSSRSWARRYSVHRIVNVTPSGEAVSELVMSFRCQDPDRGLCGQRLDVRACRVVQPRPQHNPRHALSAGVDLAVTAKLVARSGDLRSPGHDLCPPTARPDAN